MAEAIGTVGNTTSILETSDKGIANGVAGLDANGQVPSSQLASGVVGSEYHYVERITQASTTGANIIYTTLTTAALIGGTYRLECSWALNQTNTGGDWQLDITEGTNAAGSNTSLLVDEFDEEGIDSGANGRWPKSFTRDIVLTAGVKNINIEMDQVGPGTFNMFFGCIRLYRVA